MKSNKTECQSLAKQLADCLLVLKQCTGCSEDDMTEESYAVFNDLKEYVSRGTLVLLIMLTMLQDHQRSQGSRCQDGFQEGHQ